MENKKEPLMSWIEWFNAQKDEDVQENWIDEYVIYATKWHLNNAKEFVVDEAKVLNYTVYENGIDLATPSIDKQSIHTAIDNYIEINLNKEL